MTRTVNGEMLLERQEKEVLRKMLHQIADFSGIELLTYAVMGNHFHVLVRVSSKAKEISDAELIRRFRVLYPLPTNYRPEDPAVLEDLLKKGGSDAEALRKQLIARMGDVSEFMRSLKQRFAIWFNKSHRRYGPLWSDRFKSVIVENDPVVVKTIAAYIDLNPVRAGIVADPKDYRFCGYAEAVAKNDRMVKGITAILSDTDKARALSDYRMVLFGKGARPKSDGSGVRMSGSASRKVMECKGELPRHIQSLQRLKFITEGAVIGSEAFIHDYVNNWSHRLGDVRSRKPVRTPLEGLPALSSFKRTRSNWSNRPEPTTQE